MNGEKHDGRGSSDPGPGQVGSGPSTADDSDSAVHASDAGPAAQIVKGSWIEMKVRVQMPGVALDSECHSSADALFDEVKRLLSQGWSIELLSVESFNTRQRPVRFDKPAS